MYYFSLNDLIFNTFNKQPLLDYSGVRDKIEQYTGYEDKNGKPIFEGDIISAQMALGEPPMIAPVIWDGCGFWLDLGGWRSWPLNPEFREILGNIHENPELLK